MDIFNVYGKNLLPFTRDDEFTLRNALFRVVKLTKNAEKVQYKYSGYRLWFDNHRTFSLSNGIGFGKNVIILEQI